MADIQLNSVALATESSGTITLDSATSLTGVTIPAAGVTGVLPVGVTGGSGLDSVSAGLKSMQVFTSSGTWTKPAGIKTIKVYVTAGGGGGSPTNTDDAGSGGAAGATAIKIIDVTSISSVSCTVGAGSAGATDGQTSNSQGGASSFGGHCSCTGGNRNESNWAGGKGGTATGGDINLYGGDGNPGLIDYVGECSNSGSGGASYWGGGGLGSEKRNNTQNQPGRAYGSGGGAAFMNNTGSAGANGVIIVEEYA
jgi:hypothetical protein